MHIMIVVSVIMYVVGVGITAKKAFDSIIYHQALSVPDNCLAVQTKDDTRFFKTATPERLDRDDEWDMFRGHTRRANNK